MPRISVIVAVYNCAKTINQCLESICTQSTSEVELIVIDGGSNDGTVEIIQRFYSRISFWISEPDKGIYNAWNKGIRHATGDWVCFLGADDYFWDSRVLERMMLALEKVAPSTTVVYCKVMLLNSEGVPLYQIGQSWGEVKNKFRQLMSIPHPGTMHRRSMFAILGAFDEQFRIAGDYEWLLRDLKYNDAHFVEDIVLVGMRVGGVSSDPNNALAALREVRAAQVKHGMVVPGVLWFFAVVRVYLRLILWTWLGPKRARRALDFGRRLLGLEPHWTKT